MQAACGATDVSRLGHRDEVADLRQAHGSRLAEGSSDCSKIQTVLDAGTTPREHGGMSSSIEIHGPTARTSMRRAGIPAARTLAHVAADGRPSAQFEQTLFVTKTGCEIMTAPETAPELQIAP